MDPITRRAFIGSAAVAFFHGNALANAACIPLFNGFGQVVGQQCVAGAPLVDVIAALDTQHESEWCWAASTSMVFKYYRHDVSQEQIVDDAYGGLENMPANPETLTAGLERSWTDANGASFSVSAQVYDVAHLIAEIGIPDIINALAAKQPVIIGAAGHAMVLTAIQFVEGLDGSVEQITFARVSDPAMGVSRALDPGHSFVTYAAIVNVTDD